MPAGRPPKPIELKRRTGNPGRRPLPAVSSVAVLAPAELADAPEHLGPAGREMWGAVLKATGWVGRSDLPTLLQLCELADLRRDWTVKLENDEPVLYTEKGLAYANPLAKLILSAHVHHTKLLSILGLTPTDRSRLGLAEVKARTKLEEMMNKGKDRP